MHPIAPTVPTIEASIIEQITLFFQHKPTLWSSEKSKNKIVTGTILIVTSPKQKLHNFEKVSIVSVLFGFGKVIQFMLSVNQLEKYICFYEQKTQRAAMSL